MSQAAITYPEVTANRRSMSALPGIAFGRAILGGAGILIGFVAAPLAIVFGLLARRQGGRGRRLAATGVGLATLAVVWLAAHLIALAIGNRP